MKKMYILASAFALATAGTASAQGTELFFSEYNEGAHMNGVTCPGQTAPSLGNEKVIEVYNPTTATVDLNTYSIRRYSNGSAVATEDERMVRTTGANTMAPSTTYVMSHPDASLADILAVVSQKASIRASGPNATVLVGGGPIQFNGNDAVALVRWTGAQAGQGTAVIVDLFGIVGNDPGIQWSATDNNGVFTSSANQSLVRRPDVSSGAASLVWNTNTTPGLDPTMFNLAAEWEAYGFAFPAGQPADPCGQAYNDLGQHTYTGPNGAYAPLGLLEEFNNAISFYPNPASGRVTVALGSAKVGQLTVLNSVGQAIYARPAADATSTTLDVSSLKAGLYFVRCQSADGNLSIYKELVVQ
jgi:hypothetical protein